MSVGIALNEHNLANLLLGPEGAAAPMLNSTGVQQLLGCIGEVVSCRFGPAPHTGGNCEPVNPFQLSMQATDLARLRVAVETVGFQSFVSLAKLIRCVSRQPVIKIYQLFMLNS